MVPEGEVEPFLVDLDRPDLGVDDNLVVVLEPALISRDPVDQFVRLGLPGRRLARGGVKLEEEERESLLALDGGAGEEITVAETELDLDVDSVRLPPLDERSPQPVVDVRVPDVADHVRPPVDPLVEVCKALFHPAGGWGLGALGVLVPVQHRLLGGV